MDENLELVEPTELLREGYLEFAKEFHDSGDPYIAREWEEAQDFPTFLRRLQDFSKGVNLPEGHVPGSTFWLVCQGRVVGECGLRHELNDFLRDAGGHIHYGVRPSERRRGYATFMLRAMMAKAKARGVERVLITCGSANVASQGVILKCGGVLESESFSPNLNRMTKRYWIDLSA